MIPACRVDCTVVRRTVRRALEHGRRLDDRGPGDVRPVKVTCDVAPAAEGSAQAFIGRTHVIAGVRLEVGQPLPDRPVEGVFTVHAGEQDVLLAGAVEHALVACAWGQ